MEQFLTKVSWVSLGFGRPNFPYHKVNWRDLSEKIGNKVGMVSIGLHFVPPLATTSFGSMMQYLR